MFKKSVILKTLAIMLAPPLAALVSVDAVASELRPRGIIKAVRQASFVSDIGEPVVKLGVRSGEQFKTGDVLVEFDCRRLRADMAASRAKLRELELTRDSNLYLGRMQAVSQHEMAISQARVDQAAAEVASFAARASRCEIYAPFNGRLGDLTIFEYETPVPGKPFMTIIGESEFEILLIVPSAWLAWLKPGTEFGFLIEDTRTMAAAVVDRLGGQVEPVSQTLTVYGRLTGKSQTLVLAGMSGTATFSIPVGNQ